MYRLEWTSRKAIDGAKESLRKARQDYNERKKRENEKAKSSNQN